MKNTRLGSPLLAGLLLTIICSGRAQTPPQNLPDDLGGTSWQLVKFEGSDDKTLTPGDKMKYTMAFASDGSVSVRIDCNRGHGTWKSAGQNQLEFGPLALTSAMCEPAPISDRITRDWAYVRSYTLKDSRLFLSLMADGGTYEFEPIASEGEAAGSAREPVVPKLPATFVGTLPCADCPGIRYQVNLLSDHTFSSRMIYEERNAGLEDRGHWELESGGRTLVLQGGHGAVERFAMYDVDTLRKLDADGHEIDSKVNYDLKRAPTFIPIEAQGKENSAATLESTYWKLTQLGKTPVTVASQQEPHFVLDSETHRVSGSGGCNRLIGGYELNADHLTFSRMAGTLMACPESMDTEKAFLRALGQVNSWKISSEQLELFDASGNIVARFEARPMK
jgi:copper homeostasis protein (lipoprotein)